MNQTKTLKPLTKKTIILDSANRSDDSTTYSYKWDITSVSNASNFLSGKSFINGDISNIKKITISQFDIPVSPFLEPIYERLKCYMEFITGASYFPDLHGNFIPFHFSFDTTYNRRSRRLLLNPSLDTIHFDPPMTNIDYIQLHFYDPFNVYRIPSDNATTTLSYGGTLYPFYTMFTINPPNTYIPINTGDVVNIITPITSISLDYNKELDSSSLLSIIKISSTSFLVNTHNPFPNNFTQSNVIVYYSMNRFSIPLNLFY